MVKDARNYVGEGKGQISYQMIDCRQIPKEDHSFDKVIANHVLFYLDDRQQVFKRNQKSSKTKWNIYLQYLWKQSYAGNYPADQRF